MTNTTLIRRARLAAFAAQAATSGGASSSLQITALRHYPLREPVSGRTYTVIKLQTRGGLEGYGECALRHGNRSGADGESCGGQGSNPV